MDPQHHNPPWQPVASEEHLPGSPDSGCPSPPEKPHFSGPFFPCTAKEFLLGLMSLIVGCLLCNSTFYAGLNLGFSLFSGCMLLLSVGYLLSKGHRLRFYSACLLLLSLVLCASFARGDDPFVKFISFLFLILCANLSLCLLAGQNRRPVSGLSTLLDVPRTLFLLGFGRLPAAIRGLRMGLRSSGSAGKKSGAVLLGLLAAIPLLAIVIPLLISADAAFDALIHKLPQWDFQQIVVSCLCGAMLALYLFTRNTALHHAPKEAPAKVWNGTLHLLTVNTVLVAVALVYCVYLASQLAYFTGGLNGILPEGYTMAEYARRGFFELAWLCAINLGVIALALGLVAKSHTPPLSTRLLCLFLGLVTLFLAVSASAKMFLYIDSYGLTRLRLLTQVVICFLILATLSVCIWLFVRKFPYMQVVMVLALVLCLAVAWADVDTVVARYNVESYQSGKLETVDVDYLDSLGNGAIPYISRLMYDDDPDIAASALHALSYRDNPAAADFRGWNYVNHTAKNYFSAYSAEHS